MTGWRYIATRMNGDGTETPLSFDVPLSNVTITEDLSGPGGLKGSISPEQQGLKAEDGSPLFEPWSTAIYPEKDRQIRGGFLLADLPITGPKLEADCVGFTGYLNGQPYMGDLARIGVDPLDMARHLWQHKQGMKGGNLGLLLDSTKSKVKVGTAKQTKEFTTAAGEDVAFESGPYTLSWWKDHDMGKAFNDLALATPFDYRVDHSWAGDDSEQIRHELRIGYPTIGARRTDLRFMVGENVFTQPTISYSGEEYASEVVVLGAGEGRKMIRDQDARITGRLHRAVVVQDKTVTSKAAALAMASRELAWRLGEEDLTEVIVTDHPHARLGSYYPGDEILIQSPPGWTSSLYLWVRIMTIRTEPAKDRSTLTVSRVEKTE